MQDQVYFLSQNLALLLVIAVSLIFVLIGILYSRKHQGLSNYLVAARNIGTLTLVGVYFGLNKITKIIPVGMFFRASSILLFALAVYFGYEGIYELHEGIEELASIIPNILIS